jgi:hypothetical protein
MAYLHTFSGRVERSVLVRRPANRRAFGPAKPGGGRFPSDGMGRRKARAGGTEFLMVSAVLGAAQWLRRCGLIDAGGFRISLTLAERLSARGIAKWRAARRSEPPKVNKGA